MIAAIEHFKIHQIKSFLNYSSQKKVTVISILKSHNLTIQQQQKRRYSLMS